MYEGVEMEALGLQGVANGRALVGSGCVLGDGCRGTHTGSIRGGWVVGEGGGTWHFPL